MDLKQYKMLLDGTKMKEDGSSTVKELNDFLNQNIPSRIFRYRKCNEASLNALLDNKLYFSTPNMFNDPYDCLVYFDLNKIKSEIKTIGDKTTKRQLIDLILNAKRTGLTPPQLSETFVKTLIALDDDVIVRVIESRDDAFYEEVKKEYLKNLETTEKILSVYHNQIARMACLTEENDNILMWSHYADSHKGFVIEYDTKSLYTNCSNCSKGKTQFNCSDWKITGLFPILYTDQRLTLTNDYEGYVTATARNDFTLGYSIIQVVVEIYSSYEFKESYLLMNREARIATSDLDIYQELTVTCPTGGEIKYWCAVMKFKQDQKDWTTKCTPMVLLDGNGQKIS